MAGRRVGCWPDGKIFTKDAKFAYEDLVNRVRQTSFIVPGLELVIRDLRGDSPVEEKFRHDGGIAEFCEFLAATTATPAVPRFGGARRHPRTRPVSSPRNSWT